MVIMPPTTDDPRPGSAPKPVLILCADDSITDGLIRSLASRRYQPLVGRPNWSWQAALEWARPVAAVVDRRHPAARSAPFFVASDGFEIGVVVLGGASDVETIGGAVDAAVRRRSVRAD